MTRERLWTPHSRRHFLQSMGLAAVGAAGRHPSRWGATTEPAPPGGEPEEVFNEPASALSGSLSILLWSHFVPSARRVVRPLRPGVGRAGRGRRHRRPHQQRRDRPPGSTAEIQAGSGHDLIQYIATLAQFEPSVLSLNDVNEEAANRWGEQLELCRKSSFNPTTENFYAYSPGWVPDPGDYRKSLWEPVGFPNGPATWDDLLAGGTEIKESQGVQVGIGLSQEIDSNMAGSALMWSYGASVQDENENVTINSPETIAAVEFMTQLFQGAMTDEVFAWNAASNNQGLVAGQLSYILNSISAWRTAQEDEPGDRRRHLLRPRPRGAGDGDRRAARALQLDRPDPRRRTRTRPRSSCSTTRRTTRRRPTTRSCTTSRPGPSLVPDLRRVARPTIRSAPSRRTSSRCSRTRPTGPPTSATPGRRTRRSARSSTPSSCRTCWPAPPEASRPPPSRSPRPRRRSTPIFDKWRDEGLVGGG